MVDWVFDMPSNVTTFAQKISYIDGLTDVGFGGMIGIGIILVIFFSLNMMMKAFKTETTFAVSCFITSIIGILLRVLFPFSDSIIYICIIFFVIGLLYLKKESTQGEF